MPKVLNARVVGTKTTDTQVYCGRPSKWGNPFQIGCDGNRENVIEKYMDWFCTQQHLIDQIYELKGKDLVCWCYPQSCHCDFLLEFANEI
jgi:hypothetical protein